MIIAHTCIHMYADTRYAHKCNMHVHVLSALDLLGLSHYAQGCFIQFDCNLSSNILYMYAYGSKYM